MASVLRAPDGRRTLLGMTWCAASVLAKLFVRSLGCEQGHGHHWHLLIWFKLACVCVTCQSLR